MFRTAKLSFALALGMTASAYAQDPMGAPPPEGMPADPAAGMTEPAPVVADASTYVGRGVQNAAGQLSVDAFLFANLSKEAVFKPFSISPDIYFGLTDQLQLGLKHSSPMGWQTPAYSGRSLCLAGKEKGCAKVYDSVGLDALFALGQDLAAHATLWAESIDVGTYGATVGVKGKARFSDQLALAFDPQLYVGFTKRDDAGNKEALYIPLELAYQIIPPVAFALQAGFWSPIEDIGDFYQIPVGIAAVYHVNPMIDVGLRFAFDNLLGKELGAKRADVRSLNLLVGLRF